MRMSRSLAVWAAWLIMMVSASAAFYQSLNTSVSGMAVSSIVLLIGVLGGFYHIRYGLEENEE